MGTIGRPYNCADELLAQHLSSCLILGLNFAPFRVVSNPTGVWRGTRVEPTTSAGFICAVLGDPPQGSVLALLTPKGGGSIWDGVLGSRRALIPFNSF